MYLLAVCKHICFTFKILSYSLNKKKIHRLHAYGGCELYIMINQVIKIMHICLGFDIVKVETTFQREKVDTSYTQNSKLPRGLGL